MLRWFVVDGSHHSVGPRPRGEIFLCPIELVVTFLLQSNLEYWHIKKVTDSINSINWFYESMHISTTTNVFWSLGLLFSHHKVVLQLGNKHHSDVLFISFLMYTNILFETVMIRIFLNFIYPVSFIVICYPINLQIVVKNGVEAFDFFSLPLFHLLDCFLESFVQSP